MAKSSGDTSRQELVELALAGIDAQIKELADKKSELMGLLGQSAGAAPKRASRAGKAVKASKGVKAAKGAKASKSAKDGGKKAAPEKKKRVFSAATRKKLREAAKARWAREKEAKVEQ